jgi:ParB family transcriptional regulator, chromosome partitioning protein
MAARKGGLGKGLDSLIADRRPAAAKEIKSSPEVIEKKEEKNENPFIVKISEVEPNREQPRKHFDEEALQELADSIKKFGVIQPLLVQKKEKYYEIVAGERRWRAAKIAGLKEIPVVIRKLSDQEKMEIALIENIQREDLNPIEEALAYKKLIDEFHLKQEDIANSVSKSRSAITNSMRLLKLDERVQNMLAGEEISAGHARTLLILTDGDKQYELAQKIVEKQLSVREVESLLKKKPKEEKKTSEFSAQDLIYKNFENNLKELYGTKVAIKDQKGKGKIEISYYSVEELERILEMLQSKSR